MKNIAIYFFESAKKHPQKVAFREKNKAYNYQEVEQIITFKTKKLIEKGIGKGDRVLLVIPVGIEFYTTILSVFSIGATVVLIDDIKDKKNVLLALQQTNSQFIITTSLLKFFKYFLFKTQICNRVITIKNSKLSDSISTVSVNESDTALITFTSGTTGVKKAADRTHGFLDIQLNTLVEEMQIDDTKIHMSSLPVVMLCSLAMGAQTILENSSQHHSVNLLTGSPSHIKRLLNKIQRNQVVNVFIGGSIIYPAFANFLIKNYTQCSIKFVYGSTEAEPISLITLNEYMSNNHKEIGVPVGKIHKNLALKIDHLFSIDQTLIGEITVKGKHVLKNYIDSNDKNLTEEKWLHTGDIGYLKNNCLYFIGRKKYCWYNNRHLHSPLEVEKLTHEILPSATQLRVNNKTILFYKKDINKAILLRLRASFSFDQEIAVKKFNYDKRHQSRIDYEKLISLVDQS